VAGVRSAVLATRRCRSTDVHAADTDVLRGVRQQRHVTRALDSGRDRSLALGTTPDLAASFDLAMLIQEALQRSDVLVVHNQRLAVADIAATSATATTAIISVISVSSVSSVPSVPSVSSVSSVKCHLLLLYQRR